jgi:hypothetical protein
LLFLLCQNTSLNVELQQGDEQEDKKTQRYQTKIGEQLGRLWLIWI